MFYSYRKHFTNYSKKYNIINLKDDYDVYIKKLDADDEGYKTTYTYNSVTDKTDKDVRNEINGILTSYTTSQLPNYDYQMDFVHRAFVFLWAEPWIAALGGLSLCCSVAAWIIFEGRRG